MSVCHELLRWPGKWPAQNCVLQTQAIYIQAASGGNISENRSHQIQPLKRLRKQHIDHGQSRCWQVWLSYLCGSTRRSQSGFTYFAQHPQEVSLAGRDTICPSRITNPQKRTFTSVATSQPPPPLFLKNVASLAQEYATI